MLKEIKCEKFKSSIKNKTIKFHEGLNVVLGSGDAANSIGKSTLLLMIDFCFCGNSYAKQNNLFEYVDHHDVLFAFQFSDETKYFSRPTNDFLHYYECDSSYKHTSDKKPISELNNFLMAHYFPQETHSTFRAIVGRFMRIYGKNNYQVDKPLSDRPGEKESIGIKAIEELFDISSKTKTYHDIYEDIEAQVNAFKNARQYGFIYSNINSDKQLSETKDKIEELNKEIKDLVSKSQIEELFLNASFSENDIQLVTSYRSLQRKLMKLKGEFSRLNKMSGEQELIDKEDLAKLKTYFPSFDLKTIEEINQFQKELIDNVNFEINSRMKEITVEIIESVISHPYNA